MKWSSKHSLWIGTSAFICMLVSLLLMSDALKDSSQLSRFYPVLLTFTTIGLCVITALILLNLKKIFYQYRHNVAGSKMTIKMIGMFTALSVAPVLIVYFFSLDFLHRGIDSWFDLRVEQSLDNALQLSKLSLESRMKELLKKTEQIAEEVTDIPNTDAPIRIDILRAQLNATELTLFNNKGNIITSSSEVTASIIPNRLNDTILLQLQQGGSYTTLDNSINIGLHIRTVVSVPSIQWDARFRILQALYPVSEKTNNLTNNIQTSYIKYRELSYLREKLKLSFIFILTLVLFFSISTAIWTIFYFAKKHVAPLSNMVEATKAIADGDYHTQIPITRNDELGFLVASFNKMTQKISQARDEAHQSQHAVETQQTYLKAILNRLSSGVLAFDQDGILRTSNISANQILGIPFDTLHGYTIEHIGKQYSHLSPMQETIRLHGGATKDWREQIILFGKNGRQILICSGTPHFLIQDEKEGYVLVFEDITELIQAQKNATWSEMARQLAHEIKNPLTPIQLAAERLRQKYLPTMNQKNPDMLNKLTHTIIQQVKTMQEMVNTFSEYAKSSKIKQTKIDINTLIIEVLDLFTTLDKKTQITLALEPNLPKIHADNNRLRQVFNNLLKNAFDASQEGLHAILAITSKHITMDGVEHVEITISDSGSGIREDIMEHIFSPYFTTKTKGTGLGLAIVKKIIEEHNGVVWLENNQHPAGVGAKIMIRLPIIQPQKKRLTI